MGKIITGQELINIFKGCCSGQTQSFTDAAYIDGIQASMYLKNVENSGRCPALNGTIDTVFDPTMFWNQMYGGDTGYEFIGDYQLEWTSGYLGLVDTQLVDSTYVPDFQSQMLCTNLKYTGDFYFGLWTDGDYTGGFVIDVSIRFGGIKYLIARYYKDLSSGESDPYLTSEEISDMVFAGSSNIPSNSSTYTYEIDVNWETGTDANGNNVYNITGLGCDVQSVSGTMSGSIQGYSANEGSGGSFSFRGQATLADIITINSVEVYGEWENGGGSTPSVEYDFLIYEGATVATSSYGSNNTMAVGNVIRTQSSLASSTANLKTSNFGNTTYYVNIYALDWENGELKLSWVGDAAPAGNYWIGFDLKYNNTVYYRMYMPLTVGSGGSMSDGSGSYILDLSSVNNSSLGNNPVFYRTVRNTTSSQYYVWNYSSSGPQSSPIAAGGTSSYAMLLSTLYVRPYTTGACTVKTGVESSIYTISSSVSNKTVNIIPTNFSSSFGTLLTRIADKGTDFYVQLS